MKKIKKAIGLILCITVFAAMAMGSGSSDSSSATKVGETSSSEDKDTKTSDKTENVDKGKKSEEKTPMAEIKDKYSVGETMDYKGLKITYVSSSNYTSDNDFIQPADGNKFIRLAFYVDNESGSDQSISTYSFTCYADGYECESHYFDDDLSLSLSNGRTGEGAVYFEVPEDAKSIEIEYEYDLWNSKKVQFAFEGDKDSGFVGEKKGGDVENAFHVGDIIETKGMKISYLKAAEYTGYSEYFGPADGKKYIYIELEVENISDSDKNISYFSFECYADGASCNGYYGMDDALSADLSAGRKAKGTIAFEVPKDAEVIEIEFEDNIWTDSKVIFLYEE